MGSRYDDDDYDDRPRRRRRRDYDDDDYDPPRRRRRAGGGVNVGKVIGITVGVLAGVGVLVAVVLALRGSGFGGGSINYAQYGAITEKDTIDGLEKKYGRGRKIDPSEWAKTGPGFDDRTTGKNGFWVEQGSTLAEQGHWVREITAWHRWKKGKEEVYVAEGTDRHGRKGLVLKVYFNPKVLEDAVLRPGGGKPVHPWYEIEQLGVGGKFQVGGNGGGKIEFGGFK